MLFPEHIYTNFHYHGVVRPCTFRKGDNICDFLPLAKDVWRKVVPSGTLNLEDARDMKRVVNYSTKSMWSPPTMENMIISTEFHSRKAKVDLRPSPYPWHQK